MKKILTLTFLGLFIGAAAQAMIILPEGISKADEKEYWRIYGELNKVQKQTGVHGDMVFPNEADAWERKPAEERAKVEAQIAAIWKRLNAITDKYQ